MNGRSDNYIYALDIGTRKVAGILLDRSSKPYSIAAAEVIEQEAFSMEDGQVHDIRKVSKVIQTVTHRIEEKTGLRLTHAAVAAAGRSLRTEFGTCSRTISPLDPISEELVHALELEAVMEARNKLKSKHTGPPTASPYIFVAYSATRYSLDGAKIASLIGQRGESIEVEVIATFLPRIVVDSLTAALAEAGLKMSALTLEPIAALHIAIPASMRALNLALVDIGAGTSDIAITKDRGVIAYGMVPNAGDEITSVLMDEYLLDFSEAERVKRRLGTEERIDYVDVLGMEGSCSSSELKERILPAVEELSSQIGAEIIRLNGGASPQAVMLVGGGALTYGLANLLASHIGLPPKRVAIRDRRAVSNIQGCEDILQGPAAITSLGIAVLASEMGFSPFVDIYINGQAYKLLKTATQTVKDAVISAGVGLTRLVGTPGEPITVKVNKKTRVFPGTIGEPARITKNGQQCALNDPVTSGDVIEISRPAPGSRPTVTISDLLQAEGVSISKTHDRLFVQRNGKPARLTDIIADGDVIKFNLTDTISHDTDNTATKPVSNPDEPISLSITLNGQPLLLEKPAAAGTTQFIVNDIFRYHDPTANRPANGTLVIRVNEKTAGFTTPLSDGDSVEIFWR